MLLGVEHLVRHALPFHHARELLGLLDRHRADEHRLTGSVALDDVVDARLEFGVLGLVDQVALVDPGNRLVGRDRHHVKAVGGHELRGFGLGSAGHTGESVVEAVVVLKGDGGERLVLLLDRHPFLRLDRLVKAVGPTATLHRAAGELVDDLHSAVAVDEIVPVPLVQLLGPDRRLELVDQVVRHLVVEVVDAECSLHRPHALFERCDGALLLVDLVVDVATQAPGDRRELDVQLGRVGDLAGDDQRGAGFVDEDRVDLVDDAVVVAALHLLLARHGHVVAEVIEAELVVGAVGDVGGVLDPLVGRVAVAREHETNLEAHPAMHLAHPLGVARGEVVVHRDDVHTLAGGAVEIDRQRRRQGLALTRLHLGDPAEVQGGTTDELDVVVTLTQHTGGRLPGDGKGFDQEVVGLLAIVEALAELTRLGPQRVVGQRLHFGLERVDVGHERLQGLQLPTLTAAQNTRKNAHRADHSTDGPRRPSAGLHVSPDLSNHPDTGRDGLGEVSRLRR